MVSSAEQKEPDQQKTSGVRNLPPEKPAAAQRSIPGKTLSTRQTVFLALMVAMAMALHGVEALMAYVTPMPGIRLGLANIVTLICLAFFSRKQVLLVVVMRLALTGLVLGTFLTPVFWISVGGGLCSYIAMALLTGRENLSVIGISLAGAASHNLGQLTAAALLLSGTGAFYYLPWLLLWSVPMGLLTGFSAKALIKALRNIGFDGTI